MTEENVTIGEEMVVEETIGLPNWAYFAAGYLLSYLLNK